MNTQIKNFYTNVSVDGSPTFDQVVNADFEWIESTHNWCQRAFPNFEPSEIVTDAPVLDDETLEWIKNDKIVMGNAIHMCARYLRHYRSVDPDGFQIAHNNRRITRMIKFLIMIDCREIASVVYREAKIHHGIDIEGYTNTYGMVMTKTYWEEALNYKREQ
jgi:hypothetical protein